MRLLVLARHGQSLFNIDGIVNGDPALDLGLSPLGVAEAQKLAAQIAGLAIDRCVVSEFPRAHQTARAALQGRDAVAWRTDSDLNDIRIGALEGRTLEDYRAWKTGARAPGPVPRRREPRRRRPSLRRRVPAPPRSRRRHDPLCLP